MWLPGSTARVWSPAGATDRVLVAHDGPEYQRRGRLGDFTTAMIATGRVRPYHLVLLAPDDREKTYAADPGYAGFLTREIVPRIRARLGGGPVIGAGVSLGALAMLHAQWRFPEAFAGLFLQSGSFFQVRHDRQEAGFRFFRRIVRFTSLLRHSGNGPAIPVTLTCGALEENLANNRDMAEALRKQGHAVDFAVTPGGHTWNGWRDALHPHLTGLLRRVWPD
jgi:enterochelin esterase-like enzyme